MKKKLVLFGAAIALVGLFMSCDLGEFGDSLEKMFIEPIGDTQPRPDVQVTTGNIEDLAKEAAGNPEYSLYLLEQIANASDADKKKMQGTAVKLAIEAVDLGSNALGAIDKMMELIKGDTGESGELDYKELLKSLGNLDNQIATKEALINVFGNGDSTYSVDSTKANADDMALAGLALLAININDNNIDWNDTDPLGTYANHLLENFKKIEGYDIKDKDMITIAQELPTISTKGVDGEELIDAELKLGFALISTAATKGGGTISDPLKDMLNSLAK